ncbi:MAG: peptide chain release factor N(5)-glutamine methyltransferase [bacterium]|nr:peptide chain release factor N(5)-glutamine methyltransferase [bacterium]
MKTWGEILALGGEYLAGKGVPDAQVAAELLVARLLNCGRGFLSPRLAETPSEKYLEAMRRGMARLVKGEPIQYVLGEWDFRSLTLTCDRRALIPRPETEELVTRVLKFLRTLDSTVQAPLVVDVGTGSGCILLSLAKEFTGDAAFLGIDISADAVALARENAVRCGLGDRVKFEVADGLDDFDEPETIDVLVSNPPYIATADCAGLDPRIREWEPMNALDGGVSGLDFYERLVGDALNVLKPGGGVFFEIGDGQGESLRKLFFDAGFNDIRIEQDYAGHDRYASAILR